MGSVCAGTFADPATRRSRGQTRGHGDGLFHSANICRATSSRRRRIFMGGDRGQSCGRTVDAVVEVTETGSSLRANGLRIIEELLTSTPVLVANHQAWADEWKQAKIRQIAVLLKGALDAENRVGIKMNVPRDKLDSVIALLPSITAPTVAPLYAAPALGGKQWFAIDTVIDEATVRELFPQLLEAGAVGIIEYPLNKII